MIARQPSVPNLIVAMLTLANCRVSLPRHAAPPSSGTGLRVAAFSGHDLFHLVKRRFEVALAEQRGSADKRVGPCPRAFGGSLKIDPSVHLDPELESLLPSSRR